MNITPTSNSRSFNRSDLEAKRALDNTPGTKRKFVNELADLYGVDGISSLERTTKKAAKTIFDSDDVLDPDSPPLSTRTISSPKIAEKKHQESDPQQAHSDDELEKFRADMESFKRRYVEYDEYFKGIGAGSKLGLGFGEYVDSNEENVLGVLTKVLPPEKYAEIQEKFKVGSKLYKWLDSTFPIFLHGYKYLIIYLFRKEFKERLERFKQLEQHSQSNTSSASQTEGSDLQADIPLPILMDAWKLRLKRQDHELREVIGLKGAKLISKLASFPLERLGIAHKDANKVSRCSFGIFRGIWGIHTIRKSLELQKQWTFHLQPHIHVNIAQDETEEDLEGVASFTPRTRKVYYESFTLFLRALQQCSSLQEVKQKLDNPNVYTTPDDEEFLRTLEDCKSLGEVKSKLNTKLHNQQLFGDVRALLKSLTECNSLEEVQQILDEKSIKTIEVPSTIARWQSQMKDPRFRRHLTQTYYCSVDKRPLMDETCIKDILEKREADRKANVNRAASTVILNNVRECETKEFAEIVEQFERKLHIRFDALKLTKEQQDALPFPPSNKDEWMTCIASIEFCEALAAEWVDHQEMQAQSAHQAFRQAVLSKIQVENKFLNFRWTEYNVGLLSAVVQLFFCWQQTTMKAATSVLELFVTELAKLDMPGIGLVYLFYPLYPNLNFKVEGLVMLVAEHFFAMKYKPNEYSLQGYKLNMEMRFLQLMAMIHYFLACIKETLLWLNIRLIENCVMGLEHLPFEQDNRYIQSVESYKEARLDCEKEIQNRKNQLAALKLKDAKLAMIPGMKNLGMNGKEFDPIDSLVESLQEADFDYMPPDILKSFQDNFGIELTNGNKGNLKKNLEEFFTKSEQNFTERYQENRFAYLRNGG